MSGPVKPLFIAVLSCLSLYALPLQNPGFEWGNAGWQTNPPTAISAEGAHSGQWKATLGGTGKKQTDTLSQTFTVPANATEIGFWCNTITKETSFYRVYDKMTVTLRDGQKTQNLAVVSNLDGNKGYRNYTAKIDPSFAGKDVTISFTCKEGSLYPTSFTIDDVQIDGAIEAETPIVSSFEPTTGTTGTQVTIRGAYLTGATNVAFNNIPAEFKVIADSELTAIVPNGAATGAISIVTPKGTVQSTSSFTISSAPDLTIGAAYIVQSTQDLKGSIPLVNERTGYLRVFVTANAPGIVPPAVQVTLHDVNAQEPIKVWSAVSAAQSLPTVIDDGKFENSYNLRIDGKDLIVGRYVKIEIDPGNTIAESDKTNNVIRYPESGALDIRIVKPLRVTLVPTITEGNSPNLYSGNMQAFMDFTYRIWPVPSYDANVREALTSSVRLRPSSSDPNNGWDQLLNEITALWRAESGDKRHFYYGVVRPPYTGGGITGIGWSGAFPCSTGWDNMTNGLASQTLAHEIGHNFRLLHVPCQGEAGVDKKWPYKDPYLGTNGFDIVDGIVKEKNSFVDLMSYCRPKWVSDYMYKKALNYLEEPAAALEEQPTRCLMIWGRINNGKAIIEPAFALNGHPTESDTRANGNCRIGFYDHKGRVISETAFEPSPMAMDNLSLIHI